MSKFIEITNFIELEKLINEEKPLLIFKHSTRCPISSGALTEYQKFIARGTPVTCTYIDVIRDRGVSNQLALLLHVEHESPQIILVDQGIVKWSASHGQITDESIASATF